MDLGYGPLFGALLWIGLVAASVSDLRHRKVPNPLNLGVALSGVAAQVAAQGAAGAGQAALGVAVAFALMIGPFAVRLYRGGDAKLVMALGAWLGPRGAAWMCLWGVALGGVLALGVYLTADPETRRSVRANFTAAARTATVPVVEARAAQRHVPMALAFSAGAVIAALWR